MPSTTPNGDLVLFDLSARTRIEITGRDRATLLHNLCTNDVRSLLPGQGNEAFFATMQGKIVAHALLFCQRDSILLETVAGQAETLLPHIDRYVIREDVAFHDRSGERAGWLIVGQRAEQVVRELTGVALPQPRLAHVEATLAGYSVVLRRVDLAGVLGIEIECDTANHRAVGDALLASGAQLGTDEEFQSARIEAGTPFYGADITIANLPQEVARDAQTIHFAKGCYLGQETVARIDAMGHVNKTLCGVRFTDDRVPTPGLELHAGDKSVGEVTSAAWSGKLGAPLALAYVRRGHNTPGTRLSTELGDAEVVALPVGLQP